MVISLSTESNRGGKSYRLDLSDLSIKDPVVPGKIYNLTDLPFGLNGVKSIDFNLSKDWQILLYEKNNGLGQKIQISSGDSLQGRRFTSFEIQSK